MESSAENPIIQRLNEFISYTGLSSTQFADKAGIPRPTLSQMVHGRNKSVNNQMLAKLNENFPELNILWFLFGQGSMLLDATATISISSTCCAPFIQRFKISPAPSRPHLIFLCSMIFLFCPVFVRLLFVLHMLFILAPMSTMEQAFFAHFCYCIRAVISFSQPCSSSSRCGDKASYTLW